MPFDLDNDRTPKPPRKPEEDEDDEPLPKLVPLEPVSVYLAQLRATGRIGDGAAQAQPQATSPRPPVASWKLDLHTERRAPQRVILSCPARNNSMAHAIRTSRKGTFVFGNLAPHATVADLRRMIWSQLLPNPTTAIVLESWGRVLEEESWTLLDYAIKDDAKLQVRLVERPLLVERGLSRVRLFSTALVTRSVPIEPSCSGADLKRAVETALARGQYEWWNEQGEATRIASGITLVAIEAKAAEEGGTDQVALGEELIIEQNQSIALRGGKGQVTSRRAVDGAPCAISEAIVAFLSLTPEKMKLSYGGCEINDADSLHALGCRTDDAILLEFESPAQPAMLKLLRSPDPPKKEGGGGKKKK